MDYKVVENLAILAKNNDEKAKEALVKEFKPIIEGLSRKTFIHGFEHNDIVNEGYITLFKCIKMYNPSTHRFVGYTVNAIKNNLNYLIQKSIKRTGSEGLGAYTLTDKLENILECTNNPLEDKLSDIAYEQLFNILKNKLTEDELDVVNLIILEGYTIKQYAEFKDMSYSKAVLRKNKTLKKIRIPLLQFSYDYINF